MAHHRKRHTRGECLIDPYTAPKHLQGTSQPANPHSKHSKKSKEYCIRLKGPHVYPTEPESAWAWDVVSGQGIVSDTRIVRTFRCTGCQKKRVTRETRPPSP